MSERRVTLQHPGGKNSSHQVEREKIGGEERERRQDL
jgi:hypothetical protein